MALAAAFVAGQGIVDLTAVAQGLGHKGQARPIRGAEEQRLPGRHDEGVGGKVALLAGGGG